MSVGKSNLRWGTGGREALLERGHELEAISRQLTRARQQRGAVVLIEAAAGMGGTRLLHVAQELARQAGMLVFEAQASELEVAFPFGIALQLFEPWWASLSDEHRERLLDGPTQSAAKLLQGGFQDLVPYSEAPGYAAIHGLFRLARSVVESPNAAGTGAPSAALFVDDAHWADRPSLRFLAYLARRISDLPIALVATVRDGDPTPERRALATLRSAARGAVLRPGPLSEKAVAKIVAGEFPDAEPAFWQCSARLTNGNPLLLRRLLDQVRWDRARPDAGTAARLHHLPPSSVIDRVVTSLEGLPPETAAVASAVAALGDGASLRHVAAVAGIDFDAASRAADTLASMDLLRDGAPLSFVHPLVGSAVRASIPPLDRALTHRRAARVLAADQVGEEEVAVHLLASTPESDQQTIEVLRVAAGKALDAGDPQHAVRLLERALAERPPAELGTALLSELAQAEMDCGLDSAALEHLEEAITATEGPSARLGLMVTKARLLYERGHFGEAAATAQAASAMGFQADHELAEELEAIYVRAASLVPELADTLVRRREPLLQRVGAHPSPYQRDALSHLAVHAAHQGEEERTLVARLVKRAWSDGALLDTAAGADCWPLLAGALLFTDELEWAVQLCDAALDHAQKRGDTAEFATASYCRAWPLYEQGNVLAAAQDAQKALDARPGRWHLYLRTAYGANALCHLQRGEVERASRTLTILEEDEIKGTLHYPLLLDCRAQLRLAQHRPQEALSDALEAGHHLQESFGIKSPGLVQWRSTAALAHLAVGEPDEGRRLVREELELARRIGLTRVVIRDLRVLGLAEGGERGIALLGEAVAAGEDHPPRLEYFSALVDLGAALRRANQRTAARDSLRKALELSHRGGATVLEQRAKTELAATGARPRRTMLTGIEALTPNQLRVGELAAQGLTTRQIADEQFITPKTVEYHLRQIYMKLSVSSREELAQTLAAREH